MSRIVLSDTTKDAVFKLSEGNPGALSVLMQILEKAPVIDPDNALGSMGPIFQLDTLEVYSWRIWILYKDVCKESIEDTIAVLRANQLGYVSHADLNTAIETYGRNIDVAGLKKLVKERLPRFAASPITPAPDSFASSVVNENGR